MNSSDISQVRSFTTYSGLSTTSLPMDERYIMGWPEGTGNTTDDLYNCCYRHEKEIQILRADITELRNQLTLLSSQYAALHNLWYKKFEE
jgi:hypothetical protein